MTQAFNDSWSDDDADMDIALGMAADARRETLAAIRARVETLMEDALAQKREYERQQWPQDYRPILCHGEANGFRAVLALIDGMAE